jgi:hypothetical protein
MIEPTDLYGGSKLKRISLQNNNGWNHAALFFFDEPDKTSFVYADDMYWIPGEDK